MKIPRLKQQLDSPIQRLDLTAPPTRVRFPMSGLIPLVREGERVTSGLPIAASPAEFTWNQRRHSPMEGRVVSIGDELVIEGEIAPPKPLWLSPADPIMAAREAGLVGMGGGKFPTYIKLTLAANHAIDSVLVNGSESEPYVTCDHRVLEEHADSVAAGMDLAVRALGAERGLIVRDEIDYPDGYENFLVERALGRVVPAGKRPHDVGAVVINVQTARALHRATTEQRPLVDRVVTVDGDAVGWPGNYLVPIGTEVGHLLEACDVDWSRVERVLVGGPMMGTPAERETPVTAGTIAVLALTAEELIRLGRGAGGGEAACIRCGECTTACPYTLPRPGFRAPARSMVLCMECGLCEYVCPSGIPLVKEMKALKAEAEGQIAFRSVPVPAGGVAEAADAETTSRASRVVALLVTLALIAVGVALELSLPPVDVARDLAERTLGAAERIDLPGPPAFQAGERAMLFFDARGEQGPVRGAVIVDRGRVEQVLLFEAREGPSKTALWGDTFQESFRGQPAAPPVVVEGVSGATISSRALMSAMNERLEAWWTWRGT